MCRCLCPFLGTAQSLIGPSSPQTYSGTVCTLSGMMCAFDWSRSPVGLDRHRFRGRSRVRSISLVVQNSRGSRLDCETQSMMAVQVVVLSQDISHLLWE